MATKQIRVVFFDLGDTLVLASSRSWVPGARRLLGDLKAASVRIGIISNTGHTTRTDLAALLPTDFDWADFEAGLIILSSEVGHEKPSRAIFERAVAAAGGTPEVCLFCTESLVDALAAQGVGMRAARVLPPPGAELAALLDALRLAGLPTSGT